MNYTRFILNDVTADSTRYDDRVTIRTNIIKAYDSLMNFVYKYLPEKFYLRDGSTQRGDLRANILGRSLQICVYIRENMLVMKRVFLKYLPISKDL